MRTQRALIPLGVCVLTLAGCGPEQSLPVASRDLILVEAHGRVTSLVGAIAPEVVPLAPENVVKGAPFLPLEGDGGGAMAHVERYTTDDGLLMDDIMCSYMDANGMLWFGTNGGGLARYDGRSFTNYTMAHGLPDNVVMSLGGDRQGNLWIGTSTGGLCHYDGHRFTTFEIGEATGLGKGITCVLEGRDGEMWFGSRGHGVYRFKDERFEVLPVLHPHGEDIVRDMVIAQDGALWVATSGGLARYDGHAFHRIAGADDRLTDVTSMVPDADGSLWLGRFHGMVHCTRARGGTELIALDPLPGEEVEVNQLIRSRRGGFWIASDAHGAIHLASDGSTQQGKRITAGQDMGTDQVLCAVEDRRGDIWFGTRGAGLAHYRGDAFLYYRGIKPISIAEDPQGTLWVGTDNGLARFDGDRFSEQSEGMAGMGWNYSVSIDPQGRVGFGSDVGHPGRHGISWFDGRDYHVTSSPQGRDWPEIFWTMHDRRNRLWVGGRRGVELYANGERTTFGTEQGLGSNLVLCILEDQHDAMWVGTDGGGLSRIDTTTITTWTTAEGLPNNVVWNVVEESKGIFWVTTLAGLCRFDGHSFLTYSTRDGLPHENVVQAVLLRDRSGLVAGTLSGFAMLTGWKDREGHSLPFASLADLPNDSLSRYTPVFEVFNTSTGFPVNDVQTAEHALFEDSKGALWIATGSDKSGLIRFDRKAMSRDTVPIGVQLLAISLNNEATCWHALDAGSDSTVIAQQEVRVLGDARTGEERLHDRERYKGVSFSAIAAHFPIPQDLVLDHRNNRIGFEFVGIETARPEMVEYQWMLEGYDSDWSKPSRTNTASFGNINEGEYTFKVKAKSPSGVWSEPQEYRFHVLPPWWRTWWAYTLYVLVLGGGVLAYIRLRIAGLKKQQRKLVRLVDERTEELRHKKEEADQQRGRAELSEKAKEQFLANMSHEIRTPMNAIMGMTGILQRNAHPAEQDRYLGAIKQSSENLLVILNDILDMSKIEAGKISFEEVPFEPRKVIDTVKEILQFKAEEKKLAMVVDIAADVPAVLLGDPTRLNQIVLNLAGNAIKFTEHGGVTIRVSCSVDPMGRPARIELIVDVIDTGIGIPEDRLDKIFEEFTQAYSDTTRKYGGTGLGLTISKRLAELQGGSITVTSERGKGSTFTVVIPYAIEEGGGGRAANDHRPSTNDLKNLRILLAEDNDFNVMVAQDELTDAIPGVRIDHATNGRVALEMVNANDYDVVLMDVQMPEMNGYDATVAIRKLLGDKSRVPIIAMTANVMPAELQQCRTAGMNAHVPKPFTREQLISAIASVLVR
jgi:two-component system, sensor histidine kinase ChiS